MSNLEKCTIQMFVFTTESSDDGHFLPLLGQKDPLASCLQGLWVGQYLLVSLPKGVPWELSTLYFNNYI